MERDFKSVHGSSGFARGATAEARLINIATSFPRLVGRSPVELKKALGPNDGKAEIGSGRNKTVGDRSRTFWRHGMCDLINVL